MFGKTSSSGHWLQDTREVLVQLGTPMRRRVRRGSSRVLMFQFCMNLEVSKRALFASEIRCTRLLFQYSCMITPSVAFLSAYLYFESQFLPNEVSAFCS
jgi:hypothetical protein